MRLHPKGYSKLGSRSRDQLMMAAADGYGDLLGVSFGIKSGRPAFFNRIAIVFLMVLSATRLIHEP